MKSEIYQQFFKTKEPEEIVKYFQETLVPTNRGHNFFVDWSKVEERIKDSKIELNIMNSLIGSKEFNADLRKLLKEYPKVMPIIPILLAIRDLDFKVINNFLDRDVDFIHYDFSKTESLEKDEIEKVLNFFEKTGLQYFFQNLSARSIQDYVAGVEVGLDTNARKNRSGNAMEILLKPIIEQICQKSKLDIVVLSQKKFSQLKEFGVKVPNELKDRKADFLLLNKSKIINIEVNFFSGTGSKPQEIVDSYINRYNELCLNNAFFIWITDGDGWKKQNNQLVKGFNNVDYLMNLHFARNGFLETVLKDIICH